MSDSLVQVEDPSALLRQEGLWRDAFRALRRNPVVIAAAFVLLVVTVIAVFPGLWTSVDPRSCDIKLARQAPSAQHIFGTSELGCDYYSMAIYGARPSMSIALVSTLGVFLIGSLLGMVAGFFGGWLDAIISRIGDIFLGLPFLLGGLVVLVLLRSHSIWALAGTFILLGWPPLMRITRAAVIATKSNEYVPAARSLGASTSRLMFRHLLPNALASPVVVATIAFGGFVAAEATMSYLGVGLQPPVVSWGSMIFSAQDYFLSSPHLLIFSGGPLVLTVLSFILLGDALRDALDPKLRGPRGVVRDKSRGKPRPVEFDDTATLLTVEDLHVEFRTQYGVAHAVNGVNLVLEPGETLAIVGESGSGKSVTAQAIAGIVDCPPGFVTGGKIRYRGVDLLGLTEAERRPIRANRIAMIFQDSLSALNPVLTVGFQIGELFRKHRGLSRAQSTVRTIELLEMVRIPAARERVNDYPHQFSGGMRQRLMIAMALALDPDVLIADEPTTALDVTVQAQILALLKELQRKRKMGLILITHDMGVVADIADRVCIMYAGRIVEHAPVNDLYATPAHPYTRVLLQSIPHAENSDQDLTVIAGSPPELTRIPPGCAFHPRCELRRPVCEHDPSPVLVPITADRGSACHFWKDLVPE